MELRNYQIDLSCRAAAILRARGLCYMAMECRVGKTITAMNAAQLYGAQRVLFVTKKKAIAGIMADYEALCPTFYIEVVNYESAHKVVGPFDFAIIDEAHSLGQYPKPSKRFEVLKHIVWGLPLLYLSGTPSPEGYSQLYHQLAISIRSPWRTYSTFYRWARAGYVNISQKMVNGRLLNDYSNANIEIIAREISPLLLTYTQEQAGFETNIEEHVLHVKMKQETAKAVQTLENDRVLYAQDGCSVIVGDTPAALLNKLHQLTGGTVIDDQGRRLILDTSKAEAIKRTFKNAKIAIFYTYQAEGDLLRGMFPGATDNPEVFQASRDLTFIAQVRTAREGVRLDTAEAIVFYSLEYSFLSYEQARQRAVSKERTTPAHVYYCIADCGIDADILEAVRNKQDFTLSYYGKKQARRRCRQQVFAHQ